MHLTKRQIDAASYSSRSSNGQDIRWDDDIPGFGIRVYPNGRKAFILRYRIKGRKKFVTLGMYGVLTLDQARKMARTHLVDVLQGKDPSAEKSRTEKKTSALCEAFIDRHAKLHKKTWETDQSRIQRHILPAWGSLPVSTIKHTDVAALHGRIGKKSGPYEANRTIALISKMFDLASLWGFLEEGSTNPARRIDKFKEEKRDRWVQEEELPRLVSSIAEEDNPYVRGVIWMYLLTGARKVELLSIKWSDINLSRCELRLSETKAGRIHYIPLTQKAVGLLAQLPRLQDNPHVFPGKIQGQHIVNINKAWGRIRKRANLDDVRIHDLRRTVGSWLATSGESLILIGKLLNHSNPSTTAIYARLTENRVRSALEGYQGKVLKVIENAEKSG